MPDRHAVLKKTRQDYILDSARHVLAQKGVDATTMDDIAAAAEYTRRTLYSYFTSRDEILLTLHMQDIIPRRQRQIEVMEKAATGLEKLISWARTYADWAYETPHSFRLQLYWDYNGIHPERLSDQTFTEFERQNDQLADDLRTILSTGIRDRSIRSDISIDSTIGQFIYTLRAVCARVIFGSYSFAEMETSTYIDHFLEIFGRGIEGRKMSS